MGTQENVSAVKDPLLARVERIKDEERVLRAGIARRCPSCQAVIRRSEWVCPRCSQLQPRYRRHRRVIWIGNIALFLVVGTLLGLMCHFTLQVILERQDEETRPRERQQAQPPPKGPFDDWINSSKHCSDWMH